MLLVRRDAPEGSRFQDGDRASGVFGVLATGFSVLLGFVVFLAFESYDQSRSGAEKEALVLSQQVETAQFLPAPVATKLTGELVCYGRSVIHIEWPRAESGVQGDAINPWGVTLFQTFKSFQPKTPSEEAAYGKWIDQTSDREAARIDRIHGAVGVIPAPLWLVLLLISGVVFVFMLFFADRGRGRGHAGGVDGLGRHRGRFDAPADRIPRQPVPGWSRRRSPGRDGADAANRRRGAAGRRWNRAAAVRCQRESSPVNGVRKRDWVEIAATVLLACAAVATTWSSYQATRWNGEQAKTSGRVNKARIDAARASGLANAQQEIDVATFMQWVDSYARGEDRLESFYRARFRPEFTPAFDAWLATRPLKTKGAPLTPFAMPEYQLAARADAERLDQTAEALAAQVRRDIQRSSNYVLGVVLFAVALFFAGMSTKLTAGGLRKAVLAVGCILFVGTVIWIATFPVSVAV